MSTIHSGRQKSSKQLVAIININSWRGIIYSIWSSFFACSRRCNKKKREKKRTWYRYIYLVHKYFKKIKTHTTVLKTYAWYSRHSVDYNKKKRQINNTSTSTSRFSRFAWTKPPVEGRQGIYISLHRMEEETWRRLPRAVLRLRTRLRLAVRTSRRRCEREGSFSQGSWPVWVTRGYPIEWCLGNWREERGTWEDKNRTGWVVSNATYHC